MRGCEHSTRSQRLECSHPQGRPQLRREGARTQLPLRDPHGAQSGREQVIVPISVLLEVLPALVRGAAERPKANTDRLPEYSDAALPRIEQQLAASLPVYPELEKLTLSFSLERMREWLKLTPEETVELAEAIGGGLAAAAGGGGCIPQGACESVKAA